MNESINKEKKVRLIRVYTKDAYLMRKIAIDAGDGVAVALGEEGKAYGDGLILVDIDTAEASGSLPFMTMSRKEKADISLPFPLGAIEKLCTGAGDEPDLTLSEADRCVILHGEKIRLTEVEFSLLSALVLKGGEFSSREELLERVWDKNADGGIINVYIHYLREKLEKRGEKIILSSRKHGYKIDEKYLKGDTGCSE